MIRGAFWTGLMVLSTALKLPESPQGGWKCENIGLVSSHQAGNQNCLDTTTGHHFGVKLLLTGQYIVTAQDGQHRPRICTAAAAAEAPEAVWGEFVNYRKRTEKLFSCKTTVFQLSTLDQEIFRNLNNQKEIDALHRNTRSAVQSARQGRSDVQLSLIEIGGVSWVCEQQSELQCKPLWPKQTEEATQQTVEEQKSKSSRELEESAVDFLDQIEAIVNDDERWKLGGRERGGGLGGLGGRGGAGGGEVRGRSSAGGRVEADDGIITQNNIDWQTSDNGTQQAVYNINGITWLCRQFSQLQCFPVFSPWDPSGADTAGGAVGSVTLTSSRELIDEEQGYPDYPGSFPNFTDPRDFIYTNGRADDGEGRGDGGGDGVGLRTLPVLPPSPPEQAGKRTTFCSRTIKFRAKDEVLLNFDTYAGAKRLYIQARRIRNQVKLTARMLTPTEEGLGADENQPPVILNTEVNCDRITIRVGDSVYKVDYDFGRTGVKDLEVVGNLESTGMVPRPPQTSRDQAKEQIGSNFVEGDSNRGITLVPLPPPGLGGRTTIGSDIRSSSDVRTKPGSDIESMSDDDASDPNSLSPFTTPKTSNPPSTVTRTTPPPAPSTTAFTPTSSTVPSISQDNFQVNGNGNVEISLEEGEGNKQHKYRIGKGEEGEVNIEILFGDEDQNPNRTLIIDNKDYNYTLVITGTNFQIIHHDTNRNLTYQHGLEESHITGVGVNGEVTSTAINFNNNTPDNENGGEGRAFPLTQDKLQSLDVYGNLCRTPCTSATDGKFYCQVMFGEREVCGPRPGLTTTGQPCVGECRKRNDAYYWCHVEGKPWDYCSPPLFRQEESTCHPDSDKLFTPDSTDCARYLICEQGNIKLEECPEGLHYYHANRTCQWEAVVNCDLTSSGSSNLYAGFYGSLLKGEYQSSTLSSAPETFSTSSRRISDSSDTPSFSDETATGIGSSEAAIPMRSTTATTSDTTADKMPTSSNKGDSNPTVVSNAAASTITTEISSTVSIVTSQQDGEQLDISERNLVAAGLHMSTVTTPVTIDVDQLNPEDDNAFVSEVFTSTENNSETKDHENAAEKYNRSEDGNTNSDIVDNSLSVEAADSVVGLIKGQTFRVTTENSARSLRPGMQEGRSDSEETVDAAVGLIDGQTYRENTENNAATLRPGMPKGLNDLEEAAKDTVELIDGQTFRVTTENSTASFSHGLPEARSDSEEAVDAAVGLIDGQTLRVTTENNAASFSPGLPEGRSDPNNFILAEGTEDDIAENIDTTIADSVSSTANPNGSGRGFVDVPYNGKDQEPSELNALVPRIQAENQDLDETSTIEKEVVTEHMEMTDNKKPGEDTGLSADYQTSPAGVTMQSEISSDYGTAITETTITDVPTSREPSTRTTSETSTPNIDVDETTLDIFINVRDNTGDTEETTSQSAVNSFSTQSNEIDLQTEKTDSSTQDADRGYSAEDAGSSTAKLPTQETNNNVTNNTENGSSSDVSSLKDNGAATETPKGELVGGLTTGTTVAETATDSIENNQANASRNVSSSSWSGASVNGISNNQKGDSNPASTSPSSSGGVGGSTISATQADGVSTIASAPPGSAGITTLTTASSSAGATGTPAVSSTQAVSSTLSTTTSLPPPGSRFNSTGASGGGSAVAAADGDQGLPDTSEESIADILRRAESFTGSLTSHGEVCLDACDQRRYAYYWCNKKSSRLGQWWKSDFCSPTPYQTHYGVDCRDACEQRGEKYFWCNRVTGGWGYCSPTSVYTRGLCEKQQYQDNYKLYAIAGDCMRYISCRRGRPVPFSCTAGLHFDYILQSCTFKKDARCVGDSLV